MRLWVAIMHKLTSLKLSWHMAFLAVGLGTLFTALGLMVTAQERWAETLLLAFTLTWASVVDIDRFILPDFITFGLVIAGLAVHAAQGDLSLLVASATGALVGYGALAVIAFTFKALRGRDGLGMGDAKLVAASGAWLGWTALPGVLLGASAAAIAWVLVLIALRRGFHLRQHLPFGPFIAAAFFVGWLILA